MGVFELSDFVEDEDDKYDCIFSEESKFLFGSHFGELAKRAKEFKRSKKKKEELNEVYIHQILRYPPNSSPPSPS